MVNDGPTIDPELLPHLFDRFVRADNSRSRKSGSSGLGLTIVAALVQAHQGTVSAESGNGRTAFRVQLPALPSRLAPLGDDASPNSTRPPTPLLQECGDRRHGESPDDEGVQQQSATDDESGLHHHVH